MSAATSFGEHLLQRSVAGIDQSQSPITHSSVIDSRAAQFADWPTWCHPAVIHAFADSGISAPYLHQATAADLAHSGSNVVISTGTASGKSLAYQVPILTAMANDSRATALYIAPTKALGADQIRSLAELISMRSEFRHIAACAYDGDTAPDVRSWARDHSRWLFTNPDMLHIGFLGAPGRWRHFFRNLRYIVVDECHHYRGVFGSHTALVLQRTLRYARSLGADPVVIGASATAGSPAMALGRLIGAECEEVTEDGSPHGERTVALWEPPFLPGASGERGAPVRRPAGTEAARILADLVIEGARTLCFVRSRRGAETTAMTATQILAHTDPALAGRVAAYRAGYLADDRRQLEAVLSDGTLLGVATTNALELGVDIAGLDAAIIAGYPGTVASFWQQAGRAGRRGEGSLVVLVARDDPLDTYLIHHPEALLDRPVEVSVTNPTNPYILGPHMLCAAMELPLTEEDVAAFDAAEVVAQLCADGLLRRRAAGWYPSGDVVEPHADIDIRGGIGGQVMIVDATTSQLLGTVDAGRAPSSVHPGAVHLHQGSTFVVDDLDLDEGLALCHPEEPDYSTMARETTGVEITNVVDERAYGELRVALVDVDVTHQVVGYLRRLHTGEVLDMIELDMPQQTLRTRAVMYTLTPEALDSIWISDAATPGALHAAEHAAIGLLPLIATCDRWDIGGLSTNSHPDTGLPTVFVYDGYPGGAGFAERGYHEFDTWITATRDAVTACQCALGCPSCVQSPKCGNGNEPLNKAGAIAVLNRILTR